jgi:hypothetical protein
MGISMQRTWTSLRLSQDNSSYVKRRHDSLCHSLLLSFYEVEGFNFKELHFNEASFLIIVRFQLN